MGGPGGPAFSHYNPATPEITTVRKDANQKNNKALLDEAASVYPTHRVAKIQRTGKAKLNGNVYDLAKNNLAVVTLVKK